MAEQRRKKPQSIRIAERDIRLAEEALKDEKETGSATAIEAAEERLKEARAALRRIRKAEPGEERQEARREFMQDYYERLGPEVANLVRTDGELRKLFDEAIRKGWDAQTFNSELKKTDWWNDPKKGSAWRAAFEMEFNQPPGVWQESLTKAKQQIRDLAKSRYNMVLSEDVLNKIARRFYYQGWNTDPRGLEVWLARQLDKQQEDPESGLAPGGMLVDTERSLRAAARGFGVFRPESWYRDTAEKILNPDSNFTDDNAWDEIIAEAESLYPVFQGKLSKDRSVRDVAAGYISQLARYLEVNDPELIELDDPLLQRAFTNIDETTSNPTLMPLWKFTQEIKKDGRWQYTSNALDTYSRIGSDLSRMMGFVG
jgi:hypothetical protein